MMVTTTGGEWWPVVASGGPIGPSLLHAWCLPGATATTTIMDMKKYGWPGLFSASETRPHIPSVRSHVEILEWGSPYPGHISTWFDKDVNNGKYVLNRTYVPDVLAHAWPAWFGGRVATTIAAQARSVIILVVVLVVVFAITWLLWWGFVFVLLVLIDHTL